MPKIDKPSERELMEKKEGEKGEGKKGRNSQEKRARRGTQIYARPFENARLRGRSMVGRPLFPPD